MRSILLFFLCSALIFSANGKVLNIEKETGNAIKKTDELEVSNVVIVFNTLTTENIAYLQSNYHLQLQRCMTKKMCIFQLDKKQNLAEIKSMLRKNKEIKEIIPYQKHKFNLY